MARQGRHQHLRNTRLAARCTAIHPLADPLKPLAHITRSRHRIGFVLHLRIAPKQAYALHVELVQIGAEDGEELHALEQRRALVQRLVQDAAVELEPAQVAVDPGVLQQVFLCGQRRELQVLCFHRRLLC